MRVTDPEMWRPPHILVAGMGAGIMDISLEVHCWLMCAEVIAGGIRQLDTFAALELDGIDPSVELLPVSSPLDGFIDHLDDVSQVRRTAVLASGDPFFFGIGKRLAERLGRERIIALPGVTSVQTLFSRLSMPWENAKLMSLHGRGSAADDPSWMKAFREDRPVAFLTDRKNSPDELARLMLRAGIEDGKIAVGENLGTPDERVGCFTISEATRRTFSDLSVMIFFRDLAREGAAALPVFGLEESELQHERGMITKLEVRAVALAKLRLMPGLVLWDLGAGSGSVGIEASRMTSLKRVFAIEKNTGRCNQVRQNTVALSCPELTIVEGSAPEALEGLDDPDRVFIGGSGAHPEDVLEVISDRLRPGGIVVQTAVMLETLEACRRFWTGKPYVLDLVQVQASRAVPVGTGSRFDALNPVFILSARRTA